MNVTFHALGSIATAAVLSLKPNARLFAVSTLIKLTAGFATGILIHGILDFLPHEYPINSRFDVIFALLLLAITLVAAQKQNYILILACFAGSIFPDVIDLGPTIANKYLEITIPHLPFRVFPWHLKEFSGSIYDGSRRIESIVYHCAVLLICSFLLYANRKMFIKFGKR